MIDVLTSFILLKHKNLLILYRVFQKKQVDIRLCMKKIELSVNKGSFF